MLIVLHKVKFGYPFIHLFGLISFNKHLQISTRLLTATQTVLLTMCDIQITNNSFNLLLV